MLMQALLIVIKTSERLIVIESLGLHMQGTSTTHIKYLNPQFMLMQAFLIVVKTSERLIVIESLGFSSLIHTQIHLISN